MRIDARSDGLEAIPTISEGGLNYGENTERERERGREEERDTIEGLRL